MTGKDPDYTAYNADQLRDALAHVDEHAFPDRAKRIREELAKREASQTGATVREHDGTPGISATRTFTWQQIVGLIAIAYGCFVVYQGASNSIATWLLAKQAPAFGELVESMSPPDVERDPRVTRVLNDVVSPPSWFLPWTVGSGVAEMAVGMILLVGGMRSLVPAHTGVRLLRSAAVLLVLLGIARVASGIVLHHFLAIAGIPGGVVAIVVGGVILAFVPRDAGFDAPREGRQR